MHVTAVGTERLENGGDLHALIGRLLLVTALVLLLGNRPSPASRAGVADTCAVGEHHSGRIRVLEQGHGAILPGPQGRWVPTCGPRSTRRHDSGDFQAHAAGRPLRGRETGGVIIDGFSYQLPDIDPEETAEWMDSFDTVVETGGRPRAQFLLMKLLERARANQVGFPATVSSPYINSIPARAEPWFPGDEDLERRIRRYIRWNAAVMVTRANTRDPGIGGHLSTFASSASLYEVGFNHFFRGKANGTAGDQVFFQGHASPGIYARAYVEGRLGDEELDNYRFEVGGRGLSSYPHPRLMPDWWEFPTVSMGLGPLTAIYQARFNRYLVHRQLADTTQSRVWSFVGDGEFDEPETRAALSLAARERLDNLTFVVNCNLQRLDGPVRGNGKIIQELEALLRGCGWNVIKVIWGRRWDELLARDVDGVLLHKMNTTLDGDYQTLATESGAYIRENFFGPDPRLRKLVEHLTDAELQTLPRGGHDYRKLYAAYKAATERDRGADSDLGQDHQGLDARARDRSAQCHPPDQEDDQGPAPCAA